MIFRREARNNSNNISYGGARFFALRFLRFYYRFLLRFFLTFAATACYNTYKITHVIFIDKKIPEGKRRNHGREEAAG